MAPLLLSEIQIFKLGRCCSFSFAHFSSLPTPPPLGPASLHPSYPWFLQLPHLSPSLGLYSGPSNKGNNRWVKFEGSSPSGWRTGEAKCLPPDATSQRAGSPEEVPWTRDQNVLDPLGVQPHQRQQLQGSWNQRGGKQWRLTVDIKPSQMYV